MQIGRYGIGGVLGAAIALVLPAAAAAASSPTSLYSFTNAAGDGAYPLGPLVSDGSGALYGTTVAGGADGSGAVIKLTPPAIPGGPWTESLLYSFTGGSDGGQPLGGLTSDGSGALYGTTSGGGNGNGIVFKLSPPASANGQWTETVLHSFGGSPSDGASPFAGLIFDNSGALFGTTLFGGASNGGTVFELTPPAKAQGSWSEQVLRSLGTANDGSLPTAGLIFDGSGALYGTTTQGGSYDGGIAFKLIPPGSAGAPWQESVLWDFGSGSDGSSPASGLILNSAGALFGTTAEGGTTGDGTVFELTPPAAGSGPWNESLLHVFAGSDGSQPGDFGSLVSVAGTLYGTTEFGGSNGYGTIFELSPPSSTNPTWNETVVWSFSGGDGSEPTAGLISGPFSSLYGTTYFGGTSGAGTVFAVPVDPIFAGTPGTADCHGASVSALARQYGGLQAAAAALGYPAVDPLQSAVAAFCRE